MLKYSFTFQIHYKANLGETLVLVGNHPKLGNWDVKNGIKMEWSNGDHWRKHIVLYNKRQNDIDYKYVLCSQKGENALRWESGTNRTINCSKSFKLDMIFCKKIFLIYEFLL